MKKKAFIGLMIVMASSLFFTLPMMAWADTWYIDSAAGNDVNTGGAPEKAWKTFRNLKRLDFDHDQTLLLKKGCRWSTPLVLDFKRRNRGSIAIDAYGSGAPPLISGSRPLAPFRAAGKAGRFRLNSRKKPVYLRQGNQILQEQKAPSGEGRWYYDGKGIVLLPGREDRTGPLFAGLMGSGLRVRNAKRVTIANLRVQYASSPDRGSVDIDQCDNVLLQGMEVFDGGYKHIWVKNSTGVRVTGCTLRSEIVYLDTKLKPVGVEIGCFSGGKRINRQIRIDANRISMLRRGIVSRDTRKIFIEDNQVNDIGGPGITIINTSDFTISNNRAFNLCLHYPHNGINLGAGEPGTVTENGICAGNAVHGVRYSGLDGCGIFADLRLRNCLISGNTIYDIDAAGIRAYRCSKLVVANNIIYHVGSGTPADDQRNGISSHSANELSILNNTIYDPGKYGIYLKRNLSLSSGGICIKNNIVSAATAFSLFIEKNMEDRSIIADYNNWHSEKAAVAFWKGAVVSDVSDLKIFSIDGFHSMTLPPDFRSVEESDFRLQEKSKLLKMGRQGIGCNNGLDTDVNMIEMGAYGDLDLTIVRSRIFSSKQTW